MIFSLIYFCEVKGNTGNKNVIGAHLSGPAATI
jgi:hypothetical protein